MNLKERAAVAGGFGLWVVLTLFFLPPAQPVHAERENIQRAWADTILESTQLTASTPVTSSAVPVGKAEDVAIGIQVTNMDPSNAVTVTTCALTNTNDDLAGYYVPVGVGAQRVIEANESAVYPIGFPAGVESLKFTVEVGPSGGATVKLVGCSQ